MRDIPGVKAQQNPRSIPSESSPLTIVIPPFSLHPPPPPHDNNKEDIRTCTDLLTSHDGLCSGSIVSIPTILIGGDFDDKSELFVLPSILRIFSRLVLIKSQSTHVLSTARAQASVLPIFGAQL